MNRQHLGSLLDMTVQQRSQIQTPLGDKLSEARTKTIDTIKTWSWRMHALWESIRIYFAFSVLFKNKMNKRKTLCQAKHICGPEPDSL